MLFRSSKALETLKQRKEKIQDKTQIGHKATIQFKQ